MRTIFVSAAALAMALMAGPLAIGAQAAEVRAGEKPAATTGDRAAVLAVEQLVANATTPEAGLSCFAPDAVQDDFFPPQRRGIHQIAEDFGVYMDHYTSFHADIQDMSIDVQGDLAVAVSHQRFTAAGRNGKRGLDAQIRQTDVLRKRGGKWLITYQHLSLPVDLDTGKATLRR